MKRVLLVIGLTVIIFFPYAARADSPFAWNTINSVPNYGINNSGDCNYGDGNSGGSCDETLPASGMSGFGNLGAFNTSPADCDSGCSGNVGAFDSGVDQFGAFNHSNAYGIGAFNSGGGDAPGGGTQIGAFNSGGGCDYYGNNCSGAYGTGQTGEGGTWVPGDCGLYGLCPGYAGVCNDDVGYLQSCAGSMIGQVERPVEDCDGTVDTLAACIGEDQAYQGVSGIVFTDLNTLEEVALDYATQAVEAATQAESNILAPSAIVSDIKQFGLWTVNTFVPDDLYPLSNLIYSQISQILVPEAWGWLDDFFNAYPVPALLPAASPSLPISPPPYPGAPVNSTVSGVLQ